MFGNTENVWSIVKVAEEAGIALKPRNNNPNQYYAKCPFCDDKRTHLNVNGQRDVFKCYRCDSKGGVIRFYALLHRISEAQAKDELRNKAYDGQEETPRRKIQRHPAERLSSSEIKSLGFTRVPNWYQEKQQDPARAKALADWIWAEKKTRDREINHMLRHFMKALDAKKMEDDQSVKQNHLDRAADR